VDLKLEVHDSPNSAGIVIDAVRCCKLALDRGLSGTLEGPASYFMKSPPFQVSDERARELTEAFIAGRVGAACISDPDQASALVSQPVSDEVAAPAPGPAKAGGQS
jgi:myo-inositol-1-phosphate synthase